MNPKIDAFSVKSASCISHAAARLRVEIARNIGMLAAAATVRMHAVAVIRGTPRSLRCAKSGIIDRVRLMFVSVMPKVSFKGMPSEVLRKLGSQP
jgi:hypothetical protein